MNGLAKRYFRVPRREIGYLRFILESYDGLAFVSTLDSAEGLVEIVYPASRRQDADGLIDALVDELGMTEQTAPDSDPNPA
jgi:hypothetical protein